MAGEVEKVVSEHAITLGVLVKSVTNIEEFMKQSVESQKKQEVLMERLANYEAQTKSSFDRVHERIRKLETKQELHETTVGAKCDLITPKAHNGDLAYKALQWLLVAFGFLLVGTAYTKIWGN